MNIVWYVGRVGDGGFLVFRGGQTWLQSNNKLQGQTVATFHCSNQQILWFKKLKKVKKKRKPPLKQLNPGSERRHCLQGEHVIQSLTKASPPSLLGRSTGQSY